MLLGARASCIVERNILMEHFVWLNANAWRLSLTLALTLMCAWLACVRACAENAPKTRASCHSGTVYFHISVNENNHFVLEMNLFNMCACPCVCVCVLAKNAKSTVNHVHDAEENVYGREHLCVLRSKKFKRKPHHAILRTSEICKQPKKRQSAITIRMPTAGIRNAHLREKKIFALCWLCDSAWLVHKQCTPHRHGMDGDGTVGRHSRIRAASTHRFTKWIILMMKILLRSCNVINNNIRNSGVCVWLCLLGLLCCRQIKSIEQVQGIFSHVMFSLHRPIF